MLSDLTHMRQRQKRGRERGESEDAESTELTECETAVRVENKSCRRVLFSKHFYANFPSATNRRQPQMLPLPSPLYGLLPSEQTFVSITETYISKERGTQRERESGRGRAIGTVTFYA